jgi:hypothetical protein
MTTSDVLSALLLAGLMGLAGQGARAAVGLKKMNDVARDNDLGWNDVFTASRLIISLIIGFLAGVAGAFAIGIDTLKGSTDELLKLAAAGYVGTDAIEAFTAQISGAPTTVAPASAAATGTADSPSAPAGSPTNLLMSSMNLLTANVASLAGTMAGFQGANLATPPGSVDASGKELARDMQEAKKYLSAIAEAAAKYDVPRSLICAIGSRESNWGQGSDMKPKGPAGTGDWAPRNPAKWKYAMPPDGLGWGRGLMPVDYAESDFGKTGNWMDPLANILFGTNELATNIKYFTAHPHAGIDPVRAAVAAYNCGQGNVTKAIDDGFDVDIYTTGHDYSRDVLGRAAWFKANGFDNVPAVA